MKEQSLEALGAIEVEIEVITGPVVLHEGRYRLYQTPDGGMRIQYRRDDKEEDDFIQIPGPIVALSKAASEGKLSPMELMKRTMAIMNSMRQ